MRKILIALAGVCCLFFASCASASFYNLSEFPVIESANLPSDRYIVLGEVTGSSTIAMTKEEYSKLVNNEFAYEPQNIQVKFLNDTHDYGFVGKPAKIKMTVFETSQALAEYQLIQTAKYNEADAIICFKSTTTVEPGFKNTMVKTEVSGLAVKIKPDSGYSIKVPVVEQPVVEETPAEDVEESETDEVDYSDVK